MNWSKCAGYCARLRRFQCGKLSPNGANLKTVKRWLATGGLADSNEISAKGNLCETEALQLLNNLEEHVSKVKTLKLQEIWNKACVLNFSTKFYNTYLQICIENGVKIDCRAFLKATQGRVDPETYHLLLKSVCNEGDIAAIADILSLMKAAGIPADESVFNLIVLGHVVNSGMAGAQSVLQTMRAVKVPESENTHWSIINGLCRRTDRGEFLHKLQSTPPLNFNEDQFYEVLYTLGVYGNYLWIQDFLVFIGKDSIPKQCLKNLQGVCFSLIHREKPEAAYFLYKSLQDEGSTEGGYAVELLQEMITSKMPIELIIDICKDLTDTSLNTRALVDLAELTLKNKLVDEACRTFSELDTLRPHYFWPLFVQQGTHLGEKGVLEILQRMRDFGVRPDYDTISFYILKHCDLSNLDGFIGRLEQCAAVSMKDIFTPIIYHLLNTKRVDEAEKFCAKYDLPIIGERVLKLLSLVWCRTKNSSAVVYILQRICESNPPANDWAGKFLFKTLKLCKSREDLKEALVLITLLKEKELKISSLIADHIYHTLKTKFGRCESKADIEAAVDKLLDISKPDSLHIQHPREMNLDELECHYIELQSKNMETRGILRHMIQGYSRVNNYIRVEELREIFKANNYTESAGMKASLLNSYVQARNLASAKGVYNELKQAYHGFSLDSFKILDYAELLVEAGEFTNALDVLRNEKAEIRRTEPIVRNCWRLLSAAQNPEEGRKLLEVLLEKKYCHATNIILGPLIRAHLRKDDLQGAVETYCNYTEEYKCTPLQLELLSVVIKCKNETLLGRMLDATAKVHGASSTKITFLAGLAENGMEKPLEKLLMEISKINKNDLRKRCERWVNENKILPLQTLLNSSRRMTSNVVDVDLLRLSILKIHGANNDCEAALEFWNECEESERKISSELTQELLKLLNRCKFKIPNIVNVHST